MPPSRQSLHEPNSFTSISVARRSRSSVEQCSKALAKLKSTQIEAKQAEERTKKESARRLQEIQQIRRKAERKAEEATAEIEEESQCDLQRGLALATEEYEVWNISLDNHAVEPKYQTSLHFRLH